MVNDSEKQVVILKIGTEEFGVDIFEVKEIIKHEDITPVPESKDYVEGIINIRGSVITLIDLAKKLNLPSNPETKDTRTMIIDAKDAFIGMRVDEVVRVSKFSAKSILPPPKTITEKIHDDFIEGVVVVDENPIIILDLTKIFEDEELHKLDEQGKIAEKEHEKEIQTEQQKKEIQTETNQKEQIQKQTASNQEEPQNTKATKTKQPEKPKPIKTIKKVTKKKITKTLKKSEDGFHFITRTGDELKDAKELHNYVETLSDDEFKQFVTDDKNDFYNWLKHAVKDDELANNIQNLKTKDDITKTIFEHIKKYI